MRRYSTKQAAGAHKIETLGGDYALKWDDETQMSVNAKRQMAVCCFLHAKGDGIRARCGMGVAILV